MENITCVFSAWKEGKYLPIGDCFEEYLLIELLGSSLEEYVSNEPYTFMPSLELSESRKVLFDELEKNQK